WRRYADAPHGCGCGELVGLWAATAHAGGVRPGGAAKRSGVKDRDPLGVAARADRAEGGGGSTRRRASTMTRMNSARFRKLALALEGVEARPHMGRTAFRTKRKIFATIGEDDSINLMIHPEEKRESLLESFPEAFSSLGGWTRLGYVAVNLRAVDE